MTRLSEALRRAAEENAGTAPEVRAEPAATTTWEFSPVETMHVPVEPPITAADLAAAPQAAESFAVASEPVMPPVPEPPPLVATPAPLPAIKLGDADRDKIVIGDGVDPALMEQYRHLAAVLHHAQKATGARSVMVTSALPSEGKTLTATNLALTLSQSYQRRVLLIDADLRRPRLREMFALPATEGLTDSLTTRTDSRLPVHQISPTLWVLTSGRAVPDPMSLLVSPAMKQLLDDAGEAFDWVVVDTPPIGLLPDANLLSAMIDTALLVVSAQSTPYPMVQRAAAAVGTNRILGVVLNRAEQTTMAGKFNYYGYNAYQPSNPKLDVKRRRWFGWLRRSGSVPHVQ
jgi:capsular exopolysaccharide synthesis family protein